MNHNNVKVYLDLPLFFLKCLGVWTISEKNNILYKIYRIFGFTIQYSIIFLILIYIGVVWGNIEAMSEGFYILFTQASTCLKITVFIITKDTFLHLMDYMNSEIFLPRTEGQRNILLAQARRARFLTIFLMVAVNMNVTEWCSIPLMNQDGTRTFPFIMWMPTVESPGYEIGYIYQFLFAVMGGNMFMSLDAITISTIIFACAQLDIIKDKIQQIRGLQMAEEKLPERNQRLNDNNKLLDECIRQHQSTIRLVELVEYLFNVSIFFQLSGSVAIVCIIGFRLSMESPNTFHFYSSLNYMMNMLAQLFFYCWSGNELTNHSEDLRDELYQCPWYEQDPKFKKKLFFAMECMKKPILFKAGHFITLSRPTFVSILRCSYSYFALLNQVNGN